MKIKGLYVISMKSSSFTWCKLMSYNHTLPIRNYTSKPILKIIDFINLFNECLIDVNWEVDEFTEEHSKVILNMEKRFGTNELGKWYMKPI